MRAGIPARAEEEKKSTELSAAYDDNYHCCEESMRIISQVVARIIAGLLAETLSRVARVVGEILVKMLDPDAFSLCGIPSANSSLLCWSH